MITAIGDIHFGKLDKLFPKATEFQAETLRAVVRRAKSRRSKALVFLGDVFDVPNPDQRLITALLDVLSDCGDIPVFMIPGNHDRVAVTDNSLHVMGWLFNRGNIKGQVFSDPELHKIDGGRYWFCPHPHVVDQPSSATLSFGHFPWTGARHDNGAPAKEGSTPKGTWILGDFHTPQEGPRFRYAGSLTQLSFGEAPGKRVLEIDGDKVTAVPVKPMYVLLTVRIKDISELRKLRPNLHPKHTYFSVVHDAGVKIPPRVWEDCPNILRVRLERARAKTANKPGFALIGSPDAMTSPLAGLPEHLRGGRLSERQVNVAINAAKAIARPAAFLQRGKG